MSSGVMLGEAFVDAGGRLEKAAAVMVLYGDRLELVHGRVVVKNTKGESTTATMSDLVREIRDEQPEWWPQPVLRLIRPGSPPRVFDTAPDDVDEEEG